MDTQIIELRTSPHIRQGVTTDVIMVNVVYALLPISAFGVYTFGTSALLLILTATGACVLTEHLVCRLSAMPTTVADYSATITGILLALTLPPGFPLWMAAVGGALSILLGKALFGGLGYNPFNPALVGRAFLQAAFPAAITTWTPALAPGRFTELIPSTFAWPFMKAAPVTEYIRQAAVDGFSGATPLSLMKFEHHATDLKSLILGTTAGSTGETSAILILLCGAYLAARKMMNWRIPAGVLLSAFLAGILFYMIDPATAPKPFFILFSGGLMLGAMFMASDMVASPTTPLGIWIYGAIIGVVTVVVRLKGGLPEGVMYAILLGNAVSPLIDNVTQPHVYGARKKERRVKEK